MLNTVLVFLVTLLLLLWWRSRPRNAPPSPGLALPFIGHLYLFKKDFLETFEDWRQRLGNIFTIQMGPDRCVMLNGYDCISEAIIKQHESLLGRPHNIIHDVFDERVGVASLSGQEWKEQRAFLQSTLRSLGMGRNAMAERIKFESDYLLSTLESTKGKPTDMCNIVTVCVTNIICGVTFGKRFDKEDEEILYLTKSLKRMFELVEASALVNFFPVLKYIPGDRFKYGKLLSIVQKMRSSVLNWTEKDTRSINVSDEAYEDVVQAFLTEMERKKLQGVTDTCFDEHNLVSTAFGFFDAGTETTSGTILFAILYLLNYPYLQTKLYEEIKSVVGTERTPDVSDKNKMKFLKAFIMETQRYADIASLGLDRLATNDLTVGGYTIPRGTVVKFNIHAMHTDKEVWGDPEVFRPERFIDSNGSIIMKKEFMPFGAGKRNCIGEGLATMELFLFLSAMIQKFEFLTEKEGELPDMEPGTGFIRRAKPYKVRAIPRVK